MKSLKKPHPLLIVSCTIMLFMAQTQASTIRVIGKTVTYDCTNDITIEYHESIYSLPKIHASYNTNDISTENLDRMYAHSLDITGLDGKKIMNYQVRGQDKNSKQHISFEASVLKSDIEAQNSFDVVTSLTLQGGNQNAVLKENLQTSNCHFSNLKEHTLEEFHDEF